MERHDDSLPQSWVPLKAYVQGERKEPEPPKDPFLDAPEIQEKTPKSWVDIHEYHALGIRRGREPKKNPLTQANRQHPPPENWLSLEDYAIHGQRKPKRLLRPDLQKTLDEMNQAREIPPEAEITIFHAMDDLYAVHKKESIVEQTIGQMKQDLVRAEKDQQITTEKHQESRQALDDLQIRHTARMERVTKWFMDNYFTLHRSPLDPSEQYLDTPEPMVQR
ncbi:hypothetical protein ACQZV8_00770 [Magnetococcales bacterium HHB-1]